MAKPTKIVVHYDDGTTTDIPAEGVGSIFMSEGKARKCGHNPPYGKPPHAKGVGGGNTEDDTAATGEVSLMADTGESCYIINGVIVCP